MRDLNLRAGGLALGRPSTGKANWDKSPGSTRYSVHYHTTEKRWGESRST